MFHEDLLNDTTLQKDIISELYSNFRRYYNVANYETIGSMALDYSLTGDLGANISYGIESLKKMTPAELKALGRKADKTSFLMALLPAALYTQKTFGVPASVTLAQAGLESGWGGGIGYNLWGIKAYGSQAYVLVDTWEESNGKKYKTKGKFRIFDNFFHGVVSHAKFFRGGWPEYKNGLTAWAQNHDDYQFIALVGKRYATDSQYIVKISNIMSTWKIPEMVRKYITEKEKITSSYKEASSLKNSLELERKAQQAKIRGLLE